MIEKAAERRNQGARHLLGARLVEVGEPDDRQPIWQRPTAAKVRGFAHPDSARRRTAALVTLCIGGGQGIATAIERV